MKREKVPIAVIRRLPRYHRYLSDLLAAGITRISSSALSEKMRVTSSQIRQDLNNFGVFGQQGYGYNVEFLYSEISTILGADQKYKAILVGVGNLGRAIATNINFEKRGVELIALFDSNINKIGKEIKGIPIYDIENASDYIKKHSPVIAILTLPKSEAEEVAEKFYKYGISGFWNFSNMELGGENVPYAIENVHLGDSLMTLCYDIKKRKNKTE